MPASKDKTRAERIAEFNLKEVDNIHKTVRPRLARAATFQKVAEAAQAGRIAVDDDGTPLPENEAAMVAEYNNSRANTIATRASLRLDRAEWLKAATDAEMARGAEAFVIPAAEVPAQA